MNINTNDHIKNIESNPEIIMATSVLKLLEERGLKDVGIASGWIRSFLTDSPRSDIDIAYVGDIHFEKAQVILDEILTELNLDKSLWDIKGIWNAQLENPQVTTTDMNYLLFYVSSIDSVGLKSDGKLHDITGHGFIDAKNKVLRMNDFTKFNFPYTDGKIVYLCTEGCRRIAKFGWKPTKRSIELIRLGQKKWEKLADTNREYFIRRIKKKYTTEEHIEAKKVYSKYG